MLDAPTATAVPAARTVELSISGMTCTACAARVEKKLTRIGPGVVAAVNFATEQATVTAPEDVPVRAMIAAVQDAGYAAGLIEPAAGPGARRRTRPPTCAAGCSWRWSSSSRSVTCPSPCRCSPATASPGGNGS